MGVGRAEAGSETRRREKRAANHLAPLLSSSKRASLLMTCPPLCGRLGSRWRVMWGWTLGRVCLPQEGVSCWSGVPAPPPPPPQGIRVTGDKASDQCSGQSKASDLSSGTPGLGTRGCDRVRGRLEGSARKAGGAQSLARGHLRPHYVHHSHVCCESVFGCERLRRGGTVIEWRRGGTVAVIVTVIVIVIVIVIVDRRCGIPGGPEERSWRGKPVPTRPPLPSLRVRTRCPRPSLRDSQRGGVSARTAERGASRESQPGSH